MGKNSLRMLRQIISKVSCNKKLEITEIIDSPQNNTLQQSFFSRPICFIKLQKYHIFKSFNVKTIRL